MPAKPSKAALFDAARHWEATRVSDLLKAAPELLRAADPRGRSALHIACGIAPDSKELGENDGTKTAAVLLKAGADICQAAFSEGNWHADPVWYAVGRGRNPGLAAWLLRHGGTPDNSLHAAIWNDDADCLRVLLAAKPQIDRVVEGESPIFWAARLQRLKTLDLLIKAGADPRVRDSRGRTAIEIAKARKLAPATIARLEALAG